MAQSEQEINTILDSLQARGADMPQAYLFMGGQAATSTAISFANRILQHELDKSIDGIRVDIAEQGSIDAMRDVMRVASLRPVQSEKKVVVLEYMELASIQVMNALLKTLEEPPAHVLFVLISTQPLLATVMSRCQVFTVSDADATQIAVSPEVGEVIALLHARKQSGIAERMAVITTLAELDDTVLHQVIAQWIQAQRGQLSANPNMTAKIRTSIETLQRLRGNFNKKMVLEQFVLHGLSS